MGNARSKIYDFNSENVNNVYYALTENLCIGMADGKSHLFYFINHGMYITKLKHFKKNKNTLIFTFEDKSVLIIFKKNKCFFEYKATNFRIVDVIKSKIKENQFINSPFSEIKLFYLS